MALIDDDYPFLRDLRRPLDAHQLRPLDPRCQTVQFSEMLSDRDLKRVAAYLREYSDVGLRVYGGYDGSIRDLEFLRQFGQVPDFQVDVFEIEDLNGLRFLREDLRGLGLGESRRRKSLSVIRRFPDLDWLYAAGQVKDVEALGYPAKLEYLTLRSVTLPDLSPLLPLQALRSLDLKLGGTKNLGLLPEVGALEYVELWLVRGLDEIDVLSEVASLRFVFLQALRRVERLPDFGRNGNLVRLHLETMKGITDFRPIATAAALTDLVLVDMPQLQARDVKCLLGHPTLSRVRAGTGSKRRNEEIQTLLGLPEADYVHGLASFEAAKT